MQRKLFFLFFLLCFGTIQAQQITTSAGDFNSNTAGSVSWTLGECVTNTYVGTNFVLTQGFQQSKLLITSIKDVSRNSLVLSIYPNPTSDFVLLKVTPESSKNLRYMLFDMNGKLLSEEKVTDSETKIPFNYLTAGTYLLKLITNGQEMQVYKIVKH
jgi:hypothetical protein